MEIRSDSPLGPLLTVHPLTPPHTPTHTPSRTRKVCSSVDSEERRSHFDNLVNSFTDWLSTRPLPLPPTTQVTEGTQPPPPPLLRRVFSLWRLGVYLGGLDQLLDHHLTQQRTALLRGLFGEWQRRVSESRVERLLYQRVSLLWRQRLCSAVLQAWGRAVRTQRRNKLHKVSALRRYWSHWRRRLGSITLARKCQQTARLQLLSHCFTAWRETVDWSYLQASLRFMERLHTLLTPDPTVSYDTMVRTLTQTSRNLRLSPAPSQEVLSNCPSSEFKCDSVSSTSWSLLETTPLNEPPPPVVVTTATNCIRQLHGCNKVFQCWRLHHQLCKDREREKVADQMYRGRLLCRVWSVWRCALVRERVSVWGLSASRRQLLSQVLTAWQSLVQQ